MKTIMWINYLIIKLWIISFTGFCGLIVWALFQVGSYEVAAIVFMLWLAAVGIFTVLEKPETEETE